jgi:formate-dependent nitrite reductase cytochrome c552 subunit
MFSAGVSCQGCHDHDEAASVTSASLSAIAESCDVCHGEGTAEFVDAWQEDAKDQIAETGSLLSDLTGRLTGGQSSAQPIAEAQALMEAAQANYDLALNDGSYGVHNPFYVAELLGKAQADLERVDELLASDTAASDGLQGEEAP